MDHKNVLNLNSLAQQSLINDDFRACIKFCTQSLNVDKEKNEAWIILAKALLKNNDNLRALEVATQALRLFPGNEDLLHCLIQASYLENFYNHTIKSIQKLKRKRKKIGSGYQNILAISYANSGNMGKAKKHISFAINQDPKNSMLYNTLGNFFAAEGDKASALQCFSKCVELKPDSTRAIYNYAKRKTWTAQDYPLITNLTLRFNEEKSDIGKINLGHALSCISDDLGDYKTAASFWISTGALQQKLLNYNLAKSNQQFEDIYKKFPMSLDHHEFKEKKRRRKIPIFIVGLPRTGSSLLEQMISSHTHVTGLGEKNWIPAAVKLNYIHNYTAHDEMCERAREFYFKSVHFMQIETSHFTDKLPSNFRYLGLIANAIPEAKIIHISRNAQATCFSCFKNFFQAPGLAWTFDQYSTVNYYNLYVRHMQLMSERFSGKFLNVCYENLVNDPEFEMRRILEYCELPFQSNVLSPEKNKRVVLTASEQQIRRKIYKASSENWEKYKEFLPILFSELSKIQTQNSV